MTDADDKAKAEKMAAVKKRAEQLKKAKAKQTGGPAKKDKKDEKPAGEAATAAGEDQPATPASAAAVVDDDDATESTDRVPSTASQPQSLSEQSKARSTSFRKASVSTGGPTGPLSPIGVGGFQPGGGPLSPDGETAPDIYRKHVARIEELERENRRLAKDAGDADKRWQKAEEELADLREADGAGGAASEGGKTGGGSGSGAEVARLKSELAALQRQHAQLQARTSAARHGSSPSVSMGSTPPAAAELEAQLQSKSATIETMELEMSRLRAQVERLSVSATTADAGEQVAALEEKLARAERAAGAAQREVGDLKRSVERAAENGVREGGARASAETKLRALEKETAEARAERDEAARRAEALDKKAATLTTLHREQDARTQALRRDKERADRELAETRARVEALDAENLRLRKRDAHDAGGTDGEHLDELEDEARLRLERRVRELEAENSDLRRGIWHERRKELQVGPDDVSPAGGSRFTDVDLGGPSPTAARKAGGGGGLGDFFTALTGAAAGSGAGAAAAGHHAEHGDDEGFLDDDGEGEMEFDEEAFRRAQEEEARKRIERIKEVKRGLKNWEGWRLDLVESRRGGGEGVGEIFEV